MHVGLTLNHDHPQRKQQFLTMIFKQIINCIIRQILKK